MTPLLCFAKSSRADNIRPYGSKIATIQSTEKPPKTPEIQSFSMNDCLFCLKRKKLEINKINLKLFTEFALYGKIE